MKWLLTQQDSALGICVSVVQDQRKTWTCNEERPSHGEKDKLALRMTIELITKVFENSSMCIETLVPTESLMMDTAFVCASRGVTQLARETG